MAQTIMKHSSIPQVEAAVDAQQAGSSWRTLYRAAAAAALITAVLIPIQIAVFIAYPYPDTVAGWFRLLQDNPLAGLVDLDLVLVVDNVLLVVIALAVYVALRRANPEACGNRAATAGRGRPEAARWPALRVERGSSRQQTRLAARA